MPNDAAIIKQIRRELEQQGKTFVERPELKEYIELIQAYKGMELRDKAQSIDLTTNGYTCDGQGVVTGLFLGDCSLSSYTFLADCPGLTWLVIVENKFSDLTPLAGLTTLTVLFVIANQISDLMPLVGLTTLKILIIPGNQISDLTPLSRLTALTMLMVTKNQISDLTPLTGLTSLTWLDVSDNKITFLPRSLAEAAMEIYWEDSGDFELRDTGFNLYKNPLESPPVEIVKQGKEAVLAWFKAIEGEKLPLNEVKVLLVGDGSAGKTSLVKRLLDEPFNPHEDATHGILIRDWETHPLSCHCEESSTKQSRQDNGIASQSLAMTPMIKIHFWDFGGQEIMHATHQFFLSKRSLYILVLDGRKDEKTEYWLKHIESFGGGSPVLVVLNKIDQHPGFEVNRKFLQEKYPGIKGFYRLSCATDEGVAALRDGLRQALTQVELLQTMWPQSWFNVKTTLERMRANYINYAKYRKVCQQCAVTEASAQETLVEFLHDLGVSLHFHELTLLDTKVLKPKWVTQAVYQIINSPQLAQGHGMLRLACLPEILTPTRVYPPAKHAYIVELMKKFELCYALREDVVLIPDLLDVQEPAFEFDYAAALTFLLEYDFLPRSIMPRFIVRRHQDIKDELRWRTGVVLHDRDLQTTAVVKSDDEAKTITIWVNGERRREYFAIIRKTLREIHASFEKLLVTELVPLPEHPAVKVKYRELIGLEQMGESHIVIGELGKKFRVKELLNGIASEQARQQELADLQDEKLHRLRKAQILETDPTVRLKYEKQIEEEELER